ncbi:tetratricopeptide repeat protein [Zavarzinia sp. CC-PAN008]|uniref:tetratricopeptide repeat protein n=1 Tax=Zavarzinia sp. CC-PAN008 TaxID=3243332 RepID=UPI003F748E44
MRILLAAAVACVMTASPALACPEAQDLYRKGWYPEYVQKMAELADGGNLECSFTLGTVLRDGVLATQDFDGAMKRLRFSADRGHAFSQFEIGTMYDNGYGVAQDQAEAARWYQKAADQNFGMAQYNLGVLYQDGLGVPKDAAKAEQLFALSRENVTNTGQ